MTDRKVPAVPAGTRAGGRRLWVSTLGKFELAEHEMTLLREAVRMADRLDALHVAVGDAVIVSGKDGPKVHPGLVEARQLEIALARVLVALRLPDDDGAQAQRRVGVRGVYSLPRRSSSA
jgi:hypothetical protein